MLLYANKLSLLELSSFLSMSVTVDDYKEMVKLVQDRKEKIKLCIQLKCNHVMVNIPEDVLEENRDIVYLKNYRQS